MQADPSSGFLSRLVDGLPDPLFVKDQQQWIWVNEAFCRLVGHSRSALLSKPEIQFSVHQRRAELHEAAVWQTGVAQTTEEEWIDAQGKVHPVSIQRSIFTDDGQRRLLGMIRVQPAESSPSGLEASIQERMQLEQVNLSLQTQIRERRRTELQLRTSQLQQRQLFEACPIGLLLCRMDGTIVDANPVYARILGRSLPEVLTLSHRDITPQKYAAAEAKILATLRETGRYIDYEKEYLHKDGHCVPVRLSGLIIEQNGELLVWSSVEDITERRRARSERRRIETELRESQQLLQLVMNAIPQVIFWKDRHSVYLGGNQNFANAAGLQSPAEISGQTDFDLPWTQEEAEWYVECDRRVMQSNTPMLRIIETQQKADGQQYWTETNKIPLHDDRGQVVGILGTYEDITERKQAEAALQQQEQFLRSIYDGVDFSIFVLDVEAAGFRLVGLNSQGRAAFGDRAEAAIGRLLHENFSPEDVVQIAQRCSECVCQETSITYEECLRFDQPHETWWLTTLNPLRDANGKIYRLVGTTFDITEAKRDEVVRKRAEVALQQSETELRQQTRELELALRELQQTQMQLVQSEKMSSLGQLVAGVAHEINNPVNFIYGNLTHAHQYIQDLLGLLYLYQQHYPNPVSAVQSEAKAIDLDFLVSDLPKLLTSMKVGADRIQQIVTSLRTFSRMDEAEQKAVDLHTGIDSTLMILQNRLKAQLQRAAIQIDCRYGDLSPIECYAGQLNQVFMNILSNAIDALEEKSAEHPNWQPQIMIQTEQQPDRVVIRIADNGPGMSSQVQQRLFDPFFTTKPVGRGTGMGMSISYQIVTEKHGGTLTCASTPGEGTEFTIVLPL